VVALAGISEAELASYISPAKYEGEKGLKQPPYDPEKPHLHYPEPMTKTSSYTEPPVKV